MGIGMQIVYLGFSGSGPLEAEAGAQLVRLEPFRAFLSSCHLAIEALPAHSGKPIYDVRLDRITPANEFEPMGRGSGEDAKEAVRCAFDAARRKLETAAACARVQCDGS
jgi:hypothetical protein